MVSTTQKLENKGNKDNAEAVMQVSVRVNIGVYDKIKDMLRAGIFHTGRNKVILLERFHGIGREDKAYQGAGQQG
jgi:hypothetical protein